MWPFKKNTDSFRMEPDRVVLIDGIPHTITAYQSSRMALDGRREVAVYFEPFFERQKRLAIERDVKI